MPSISIHTNLSSLIAQQSLKQSSNKLNQAVERMSTGFKINHAKDNAANYSISTNMTTKIGAYQVAEDNVAMGLDLLSTANGSLDQISDKLSRLRALAEQSANGTYGGGKSKLAINAEANSLVDEIERLYNTTEYNGKKILGENTNFDTAVTIIDISDATPLAEVSETSKLALGKYTISTQEDLEKLSRMQNNSKLTSGSTFVLTDDIYYVQNSPEGFTPIGKSNYFYGKFYGNGHVISDLVINAESSNYVGLFGRVGSSSTIQDLGLENVDIVGYDYVGGLAGYFLGNAYNCYVSGGSVSGTKCVGGFASRCSTSKSVEYCHAESDVFSNYQAGGMFCTITSGNLKNCYFDGCVEVDVTLDTYAAWCTGVGGFAYTATSANTVFQNCYTSGEVIGDGLYCAGFVAEKIAGTVENCYANSNITSYKDSVVGGQSGTIAVGFGALGKYNKNCYSTGIITAERRRALFANDIGSDPTLENCYALGELAGDNWGGAYGSSTATGILCDYANNVANITLNGFYYNEKYADSGLKIVNTIQTGGVLTENEVGTIDSSYRPFLLDDKYAIDTKISTQVGINNNDSSSIMMTTSIKLNGLSFLRRIGLNNQDYMSKIDELEAVIAEKLVEYGSAQNRLESALDEISTQYENLVSSRSTLRDADISEVSSEYIRQQILQEASATLLATANQSPSIALQLI